MDPMYFEMTIQEAANFLNVSNNYLAHLLQQDKIRFRMEGKTQLILLEALIKFRENSKEKGRKLRTELTKEAQDLDLGY